MIFEILAIGLIISAILALFLDEVVYSIAALSGTFFFTAMIYFLNGAIFAAIFQFVVGVGTLAVLFLSGEMLGEKPARKTSPMRTSALVGVGFLLSIPAIFLSVTGPTAIGAGVDFSEALWDLRGVDVLLQGIVILTIAMGIIIVLTERRKK